MADANPGPFREKSLERLSSPERLDQLLTVVDRKSWLPLSTLGALVLVLLVWSVAGRIPITVQGSGILVQPRQVVTLQSPGAGRLAEWSIRVGDRVAPGQVLGRIARSDLEKQIVLQRARLAELRERSAAADQLRRQRVDLVGSSAQSQAQGLLRQIRESRGLAEQLRQRELEAVAQERSGLQQQWNMMRTLPVSLEARVRRQRELFAEGIVSHEAVTQTEDSYIESMARVSDLERQLRGLDSRELEIEQAYLDRLQRVADLTVELEGLELRRKELDQENLESASSYEQQIAEVEVEATRLEQLLETESTIVSQHGGSILEINAAPGQELSPGARLASLAIDPGPDGLVSLGYFSVRDGKRLAPGLEIHVSPDPAERQRFGSIVGHIESISPFPVTLQEVQNVVGNDDVAARLIQGGRLIQVFARLETDAQTSSGYRWSASRGPDMQISAGTTASVRAIVEQRRPVAFVLPFLRSASGID